MTSMQPPRDTATHPLPENHEWHGLAHQLIAIGCLSAHDVADIERAAHTAGRSWLETLLEHARATTTAIEQAASRAYGLAFSDLQSIRTERLPATTDLPTNLLRKHGILPLERTEQCLRVAIPQPATLARLDDLQFATGLVIEGVLAPEGRLRALLDHYLSRDGGHDFEVADVTTDTPDAAPDRISDDDAPVVRFIDGILRDAIHRGASDIHFEPYETHYRIRLRIDGMLVEVARPPIDMRHRLAARLKVMAQLDISERRLPQDGAIRLQVSGRQSVDFRLSSMPTVHGEKLVLRLLDPTTAQRDIDALGFTPEQQACYIHHLEASQGMILVTGPTGSGKTVTLYAGLAQLNTQVRNISTAEDPVEVRLAGVNQLNVAPRIGLDFATALRAFLRQDPDVVMVGEIRDRETADIAIKASQTGHLVLSTLHTNSAAETLTRLSNMGVAAFNIASSVSLIIAQRLVRRLCLHCRHPADLPRETLREEGFNETDIERATIYAPVGCQHCHGGYHGRVGIHEMLPVTDAIAQSILRHDDARALAAQARHEGCHDLRHSGLRKVMEGVTSLEEVNRVIGH
ncbi:type IV-A pilus assembly ATPase PilB [Aidingimonas halophila]|uniref:Type IV pilus assembly protein PilB n=1 Tax=Aidingimonas halophila TaxID=574349 RepID=A0A1H3D4Y9_9GAMM|nr:type IV-A pilus assembly ATPase PilB [Aidingimonas halophila]GHC30533.1 type IV-A pilus assembly ATPase PilB [Aidingimonas halophila]SDX61435.1 type IV pilus assembly protein PilB [Aidingimonas halophila]